MDSLALDCFEIKETFKTNAKIHSDDWISK